MLGGLRQGPRPRCARISVLTIPCKQTPDTCLSIYSVLIHGSRYGELSVKFSCLKNEAVASGVAVCHREWWGGDRGSKS